MLKSFFYGKGFKFNYISSILPIGVSGAETGRPSQNCQVNKSKFKNTKVVFGNWFGETNQSTMEKFSKDFYDKTGIKIKIKKITVQQLIDTKKPKLYNLTIIVLDTTSNDPLVFFDRFGDEKKSKYNFRIPELEKIYNHLLYTVDQEEKHMLVEKATKIIISEYLALPIHQSTRTVYYPPYIKNIIVGRGFLEYPEVAEFTW